MIIKKKKEGGVMVNNKINAINKLNILYKLPRIILIFLFIQFIW